MHANTHTLILAFTLTLTHQHNDTQHHTNTDTHTVIDTDSHPHWYTHTHTDNHADTHLHWHSDTFTLMLTFTHTYMHTDIDPLRAPIIYTPLIHIFFLLFKVYSHCLSSWDCSVIWSLGSCTFYTTPIWRINTKCSLMNLNRVLGLCHIMGINVSQIIYYHWLKIFKTRDYFLWLGSGGITWHWSWNCAYSSL